eukprot:1175913-Prymnesium_polylepis.1
MGRVWGPSAQSAEVRAAKTSAGGGGSGGDKGSVGSRSSWTDTPSNRHPRYSVSHRLSTRPEAGP